MIKKFSAALSVFIVMAIFSINAYAGKTDNTGSATASAVNAGISQTSLTDGAIKASASSKSAISGDDAVTSESAVSSSNDISKNKPDFWKIFNEVQEDGKAIDNGEFIVRITSPDKDKDSTYSQIYILSGNSDYDDVMIAIAKYNAETKKYEPTSNTDGEKSWKINDFRMFTEKIALDMGVNRIKIMAYRTSQMTEAKAENIQVNCFTIERLDKSIAEQAVKKSAETVKNIGEGIGKSVESVLDFFTGKSSK